MYYAGSVNQDNVAFFIGDFRQAEENHRTLSESSANCLTTLSPKFFLLVIQAPIFYANPRQLCLAGCGISAGSVRLERRAGGARYAGWGGRQLVTYGTVIYCVVESPSWRKPISSRILLARNSEQEGPYLKELPNSVSLEFSDSGFLIFLTWRLRTVSPGLITDGG